MGSFLSAKWPWFLVGGLWLLIFNGGPLQIANLFKTHQTPSQAVRAALGPDVRLEQVVRIRPHRIGEPGRRMDFGRPVACGVGVSARGATALAVIYPHWGNPGGPSVVTSENPAGTRGESFIGPAVLSKCREARARAFPDWRQSVANALVEMIP